MQKCTLCFTLHYTQYYYIYITVDGVDKLLSGQNPNKAQGPDQISPRVLKELHSEIAPILIYIFRLPLETGIVPDYWKHATIASLFKKAIRLKPATTDQYAFLQN